MVPVVDQQDGYWRDWNYLYDGTRTRDIQNRYPVPQGNYYHQDQLKFVDVTPTGSNTWRHKNDWYYKDLSQVLKPPKMLSASVSDDDSCSEEGYVYGAEHFGHAHNKRHR